ncbi:MAG: adenylosuccinate lyase [Candidatus Micrarchaeota archaeon]|nr:adenylosuccinate lyase [Candidatus Micrarchaeota archaeon]
MSICPIEQRYRSNLNSFFEQENVLKSWLRVEVALAKAHAALGNIPAQAAEEIEEGAKKVKLERVIEIEEQIHHDLMAMVKALEEQCPNYGGYVHYGATSYDIEDTAMALLIHQASAVFKSDLVALKSVLKEIVKNKRNLVCVGRTHGQHAVPTTYGLVFANYLDQLNRAIELFDKALELVCVGKMTGAVGTGATFGPKAFEIQKLVMEELGLKAALVTTQVVSRDRHANLLFVLALIASILEQIAKDIRNLSRPEILEVAEGVVKSQVGSSTMPHKKNPHKSERVCSLARFVRANVLVGLENVALEHQRDLTNSANERIILSHSFILVDYMILQMKNILTNLVFYEQNIKKNLELSKGAILSERVMIALTEAGMSRQKAHELLRLASWQAQEKNIALFDLLSKNKEVLKFIKKEKLKELFDYTSYIGQAQKIVDQVLEY